MLSLNNSVHLKAQLTCTKWQTDLDCLTRSATPVYVPACKSDNSRMQGRNEGGARGA